MSSFPRFNSFPPEIRHHIWEDALHTEAEDRYILVHRSSLKVIPHKRSTRSAVMVTSREARYCALRFYDVKLDVWTVDIDFEYDYEAENFSKVFPPSNDPQLSHLGNDPMAFWQGRYGKKAREIFATRFWHHFMRDRALEVIESRFRTPAQLDFGNEQIGCVFLSSQFDKFTLSSYAQSPTTAASRRDMYRSLELDVCVDALLQREENKVFRRSQDGDQHGIPHTTIKIPSRALQKIRCVVDTFFCYDLNTQHRCGGSHWNDRQWRLGSFKAADQLYRAALNVIPAKPLRFEQSQGLAQWKRTKPGSQHKFICTCSDQNEEDV
ncbi:uncharacterized protein PG998_010213 [Apiospora kogelbergensis]|uniref:uncharacterized protein n=1 Tax=Apiospora kogelbergensis TaxID=1337665 RepID=UPI003131E0B5